MTTIRALAAVGVASACAILPAAAAPFAYVGNVTSLSVSVIDIATNTVTATIPMGCSAGPVAVNSTSTRVYVTCVNTNDIKVIDTATNTVITTTFTCNSAAPTDAAVSPDGTRVYVTCISPANTVSIVDTATNTLSTTVTVGTSPNGVAVNPAGSLAYAANTASHTVSVIDTATNTVTATIPVGLNPRKVAFNPGGTRAYVSNSSSDSVGVIDTATHTVVATIPVGSNPSGIAVSPDGSRVVVANSIGHSVSVIDASTNIVTATVPLGAGTQPRAVAIPPDGAHAYIANQNANNVAIMNLATNALSTPVAVGTQPFGIAIVSSTPSTVTIDQAAAQADPTNAAAINFTVVFGEDVTGFTGADVSFAGSTAGGALVADVTGGPSTYNVAVSGMTSSGIVVAGIPAGVAADLTGSPNLASTSTDNTVAFDNLAPAVTIDQAIGQVDPATGSPVTFTVVFSEPVTGFTASDVSFAGSTAGGTLVAGVSGSGATYTVSVTGMTTSGNVVASIPAGGAQDSVGNPNLASTSTDNTVTFGSNPSVTINQAAGQADPTNVAPVLFTVTFSEPVTGFTAADVMMASGTLGGSAVASVTGSGAAYTVSVTGMSGQGTLALSIPAGAATNGVVASLASTSTDNSVTFDNLPPAGSVAAAPLQPNPATTSPILFVVNFTEPVIGFTSADVGFTGSTAAGPLVASVSGSGATYTVSVSGMTSNGFVLLSVPAGAATDLAGNPSLGAAIISGVAYTGASAVVTTFTAPSATGSGNITAQFTGGGPTCSFSGPQFIGSPPGAPPIPPTVPPGSIGFPHGLFAFTTVNCTAGSTLAFTVTYPGALPAGTQYWKYGPEPGNATPHWYVLPATITGNVATFTITDGAQGDDDLTANGTIVDQGGPGFPVGPAAQQTPTMSQWAMALVALLMAMFAAGSLRRRRS